MHIGDFRKIFFPDLLTFLHSVKKSGRLSVVQGTINKQIVFRLGLPEQIDSTNPADRFTRFLVEQGVLTEQEEKRALRIQSTDELSLDSILLREGLITPEDHRTQLQRYTANLLYPLFAATEGTYRFEEIQMGSPARGGHQDFATLLIHGIRRIQDARLITAMYGDPGQIPLLTRRPEEKVECLFTDYEQAIIDQIDGARTVKQISSVTGLELSVVIKTVLILSYLGCVSDKVDLGVEVLGAEVPQVGGHAADMDAMPAALPETMGKGWSVPRATEGGTPKQQWIRSLLGGVDKESLAGDEAPGGLSVSKGSLSTSPSAPEPVSGHGDRPSRMSPQASPADEKKTELPREIAHAGRSRWWKVGALLVVLGLGTGAILSLLDMDHGRLGFRSEEDRSSMDRSKVREKGTPSEQRENVRAGETASDGTVGDALRVAEQPASAPPSSYGMKEKPAETDGAPGRDSQEPAAEENGQGAVSSGLVTRFIEDYAGTAERGDEESLRSDESGSVQLVGELSDPEGQGEGRALVRVTGVHHEIEQGHERIVVDLQGPISFKKYELPEQNIVYIALRQSTVPSRLRDGVIHVSSDIIKSMRLGQFTLEVARLVVRLEKRVNVSVFSVNDPDRVVLVLTEKDKGS